MKKRICIFIIFIFLFSFSGCSKNAVQNGEDEIVDNTIAITPISPLVRDSNLFVTPVTNLPNDFILGVDVSSMIAEEKSGVKYYNEDGIEQDLLKTLAENGINTIRIRVWNDPNDSNSNSYGGGNNDISTAIEIGKRATAYGLKVMIDFHYSDFWADPSKQMAPKAWKDMDIDAKSDALYTYTKDCMEQLLYEGVNVTLVQIGNETTGAMSGETKWSSISKLMNAGARAIREVSAANSKEIKIAVHFTNPENPSQYIRYAQSLMTTEVDYDVFASSYYPYWHGTLDNLTNILTQISEQFDKEVMVAEVSYTYTMEDSDFFANSISNNAVCEFPYPITVQGQADCIRDVADAVTKVGQKGIGVIYWEPAWIAVPGESHEEKAKLWEKYGSGWASSYASEYDPDDAGVYYGGSSWDNQALFDATGHPLDSLSVFRYLKDGAVTEARPDSASSCSITVRLEDSYELPDKTTVFYNDGSSKESEIIWNKDDLSAVSVEKPDTFIINGTVVDQDITLNTTCTINVVDRNYLENADFEDENTDMWVLNNIDDVTQELFVIDKSSDAVSGTHSLHFYSPGGVDFTAEQTVTGIPIGDYHFTATIHGGDASTQDISFYVISDGETYTVPASISSWREFDSPVISSIPVTNGIVTVGVHVTASAGAWGNIDDFILAPNE